MSEQNNNILAIASGKGGVGKTWLSVTLAHLVARNGKRVLLFDGDIGLANVDVQLGLTPQCDLNSVLSGRHTLKEAITRFPEGKFDIIAGRSGSTSLASMPLSKLQAITDELLKLKSEYDLISLALGAGIEQNVQYMASLAGRCLVVVTDEPTSLTDAYAFIKVSQNGENPPQPGVVVNMAATQKEGEQTYHAINKACMNFLSISPTLYGIIRRDNKVKDSIRNQKSLLVRAPHSTAATDAAALSIKLMKQE